MTEEHYKEITKRSLKKVSEGCSEEGWSEEGWNGMQGHLGVFRPPLVHSWTNRL